jgi:hypothetical protein
MCRAARQCSNRKYGGPRFDNQDDFQNISRVKRDHWAKDMESSKRYLLQAEVEYWHEMLRLNETRLPSDQKKEMRHCLKKAVHALNTIPQRRYQAAA